MTDETEKQFEFSFPFEFIVDGVPLSLQANSKSKKRWQERIKQAAQTEPSFAQWATDKPVHITIYHFPSASMKGDLDNIIKPILDALNTLIYLDDKQVFKLSVQRFEPDIMIEFSNPSPKLLKAKENEGSCVYIKIDIE